MFCRESHDSAAIRLIYPFAIGVMLPHSEPHKPAGIL